MVATEMPLHDHFRANVRRRREELSLTQQELAERLEVSRPYVAQVEAGDHSPTLSQVEKFAKALKCPALSLLMALEEAAVGK